MKPTTATEWAKKQVSKEANHASIVWKPINDRIITVRFSSTHVRNIVVKVYALKTEEADDVLKDEFYDMLQGVIDETPKHDLKIILDWNAQFNNNCCSFEPTINPFISSTHLTDNIESFIWFCEQYEFCVGNTFFSTQSDP